MKRILCLLLSVVIASGLFVLPTVTAEEGIDETYIQFLNVLGVFEKVDKSGYTAEVTREDFAYYVAKISGISTDGNTDGRSFMDVPAYSYAFSAINNLADAEIISRSADGKFRPYDYITYAEGYTFLLNAMGYGSKAKVMGNWPYGYHKIARELDIAIGEMDEVITYDKAAELITKALCAPIYDTYGANTDGTVMYKSGDNTLLWTVFSMKYEIGTLQAFSGGSLDSKYLPEKNDVIISGKRYILSEGFDASPYLGNYIEIYYKSQGVDEIIFMRKYDSHKENIVIDIEMFDSYEDNIISYYKNEKSQNASRISLEKLSTIVYNGEPLLTNVSGTFKGLNKGTVTLKDSDNNGAYDVVLIEDYKNFVVRTYDQYNDVVFDKLTVNNKIDFINKNYIKIMSFGKEIPQSSLVADLVLSVAQSKSGAIVSILACGDLVSGKLQSMNKDYIVVDGVKYEIENSYKNTFNAKIGSSYVFHLDNFGKVAYVSKSNDRRMKYAYLINGTITEGMDKDCVLKIFTEDGEMLTVTVASKVKIDAQPYIKPETILEYFKDSSNQFKAQLIEYAVNGKGEICEIDTALIKNEDEDSKNSLRPVFGDTKPEDNWWGQQGRYMYKALLNTQVVTFMVPQEADADDKYYRISNWQEATGVNASEWWEAINMYWRSDDSAYVDVIVKPTSTAVQKEEKSVVMVTEIGETVNSDGDVVALITGVDSAGSNVSLNIEKELCECGIDKGDLVVVSSYMTGDTAAAKLVYDASTKAEPSGFTTTAVSGVGDYLLLSKGAQLGSYRHETQLSFGYAKKVFDEGIVSMSRYLGGNETERMIFPSAVAVYDSKTDEVYVGSIADVKPYDFDKENCSKLFYHTYLGVGRGMFIYK